MEPKETISQLGELSVDKAQPEDIKNLWDRWDKTQKEETPSEYVRGWNLLGVGLFITGAVFKFLGSGVLQIRIGTILIASGCIILAVKKYKKLRQEK
jgi:hypothetical protein